MTDIPIRYGGGSRWSASIGFKENRVRVFVDSQDTGIIHAAWPNLMRGGRQKEKSLRHGNKEKALLWAIDKVNQLLDVKGMIPGSPKGGYDFSAKESARRWVWNKLLAVTNDVENKYLLLESAEGLEIHHLVNRGIKPEQLYVVNRDPGVCSILKSRFPGIHTYPTGFGCACQQIADEEGESFRFTGTHVDFCGPVSRRLVDELSLVRQSNVTWCERVVVTVLRGREPLHPPLSKKDEGLLRREQGEWWYPNGDQTTPTEEDQWRVHTLHRVLQGARHSPIGRIGARPYTTSSGRSMLSVGWSLVPIFHPKREGGVVITRSHLESGYSEYCRGKRKGSL